MVGSYPQGSKRILDEFIDAGTEGRADATASKQRHWHLSLWCLVPSAPEADTEHFCSVSKRGYVWIVFIFSFFVVVVVVVVVVLGVWNYTLAVREYIYIIYRPLFRAVETQFFWVREVSLKQSPFVSYKKSMSSRDKGNLKNWVVPLPSNSGKGRFRKRIPILAKM